jgi:hypothetical protein
MGVLMDKWAAEGKPLHVEMENQDDIDMNNIPDTFLCFHIAWGEVTQKNVAENPDHRYYGDVVIILMGKKGTGVRDRLLLEDEITEHFKFKALGGVQTQHPTPSTAPGRSEAHDGWHSMTVSFPFFADSNTQPSN